MNLHERRVPAGLTTPVGLTELTELIGALEAYDEAEAADLPDDDIGRTRLLVVEAARALVRSIP